MDGFLLYTIVNELKETVVGQKIEKIHMPARDEVHFVLRGGRLKININSSDYSIYLSKHPQKYPDKPFSICMYLRKHLTNAIITDISMNGLERIVCLHLLARDEMGVRRNVQLYAELMGRYSNIILTDEKKTILECFKHASLDVGMRTLLPGIPYELPPLNKKDPLCLSVEELEALILEGGGKPLSSKLADGLQGFSKKIANEVIEIAKPVYTEGVLTQAEAHVAATRLKNFFEGFVRGEVYAPVDANAQLDEQNLQKRLKNELHNRMKTLQKVIGRHLEKRQKKLAIQLETLLSCQNADTLRKYADLITANLYRVPKNAKSIVVEDYFNNLEPIEIPLDERYSVKDNAGRYYKQYNKLKVAKEITQENAAANEMEIAFLQNCEYALQNCGSHGEVDEVEFELAKYGYYNPKGKVKKPVEALSEPMRFVSSDGYEIYVGKNSRQNDYLTLRFAKPTDLWLHAKGAGSHVILKMSGEIPDVALIEAATLAGYYSKQRNAQKFEIDYTFRKNIKKPPAAKPGMVIYDTYYTLNTKNDSEILKKFGLMV